MKRKNQMMQDFSRLLPPEIGQTRTQQVMDLAWKNFERLLQENPGEPRALKVHTVGTLYPAVSIYEALQRSGMAQPEALGLMDLLCSRRAEKQAQSIRTMLKIPGLYRKMPAIFRWMTVHQFGEAAGFRAHFYDTDKRCCKFDMTRCAYYETCTRLGCPELTPCFCHTDDVTDGHMHPKIRWHRTQTIGEGGSLCDFQITVED